VAKKILLHFSPIVVDATDGDEAIDKIAELLNRVQTLITDKEDIKVFKEIDCWYTQEVEDVTFGLDPDYIPADDLQEEGYEETLQEKV
jgi:Ni2+-binding GTPase involved in maturation of urease and hydrogenase